MAKNLVIVESPAKAKTIEKFLGKDFTVMSSYGHVRDLKKKQLAIDIENGFEPIYEVSEDKKKIVSELAKIAKKADMVWLATDEDREGEAISWHLEEALNLDKNKTKRITFHEITKSAILESIKNPREIDRNLVNAQQARRVLDRLVGFELSPVLWKKIKPSLSAGRVQSVAVRLIVEREKEINEFTPETFYRITADLISEGGSLIPTELNKRFSSREEAEDFLKVASPGIFKIENLEVKPTKRSPSAPFTTSTLQQEASRKLSYSVSQTMVQAQKLYEAGFITYMRTDSVNLSQTALDGAKVAIEARYGKEYSSPKQYATKSKGAQEAHEAIRPTDMGMIEIKDHGLNKLYSLIWKRTLASQMSQAEIEKTTVNVDVPNREEKFIARGEVVKFDGFLKVYLASADEEDEEENKGMLPPLAIGELLKNKEILATQRFTKHPARYSEAALVKKLEELGIGRPSTYAPTISTIQKRQYIHKESREGTPRNYWQISLTDGNIEAIEKIENTGVSKGKLFPTDIGIVVNDFLVENFSNVLNYSFTAEVEKEFDEIAQGLKSWNDMLKRFYEPFHADVEKTTEESERAKGERLLGEDPKSGRNVYAKIGRYGPMIQMGEATDEEKPRFASLRKDQSITTLTFDEAMKLFELPRSLGNYEEEEVVAAIGRFGPYIRHGKKFVSIPKDHSSDVYSISLEEATELIEVKKEADKNKFITVFKENDDYQVLNGRYGPYIKAGKQNVRIPKDVDPKSLSLEDCIRLSGEALKNKGKGRTSPVKKKVSKPSAVKNLKKRKTKAKPKTKKSTKE